MAVKPNHSFRLRRRGYDIIEVDSFLRSQQEIQESLTKELEKVKASFQDVSVKLAALEETHQKLLTDITVREKAADEVTRVALKEANLVVETAQKNADSIVKESLQTARQILVEMSNLGNEAIYLKRDVRKKVDHLREVVDQFTLPNIPSLDCLDLIDENEDEDKLSS